MTRAATFRITLECKLISIVHLIGEYKRPFQFKKSSQLIIGVDDEPLSVAATRVSNPDRSPLGVQS
jgi:hypothetical protein